MVNTEEIEHHMMSLFGLRRNKYTINDQGIVDVMTDVQFAVPQKLEKLPVQFGHVKGYFDVKECGLTSMWGMPRTVTRSFFVSHNKLLSLQGGPDEVHGNYDAMHNPLTDLGSAHTQVFGDLDVENGALMSLEGCPQVHGDIWVRMNPLKSLKGTPTNCQGLYAIYHPDLAVLPGLVAQYMSLGHTPHYIKDDQKRQQLRAILDKYQGGGKDVALKCALELKQAGFGDNAKW